MVTGLQRDLRRQLKNLTKAQSQTKMLNYRLHHGPRHAKVTTEDLSS